MNRDTTGQYIVPNNNTIVSQIDFAKSWFKARYMIMIPLTGVIIVNLYIFYKHGVKQRYILIIYPIHIFIQSFTQLVCVLGLNAMVH